MSDMFKICWKNVFLVVVLFLLIFSFVVVMLFLCISNFNVDILLLCKFVLGVYFYILLIVCIEVFLEIIFGFLQYFFNVFQMFDIKVNGRLVFDYNKESGSNFGVGVLMSGSIGRFGGSYGGRVGVVVKMLLFIFQVELYGSVFVVIQFGSNGGGDLNICGRGGGFFKIYVCKFVVVGIVQVNGQCVQQNDGGGSGGGIFVDCFEIDGNGRMEVFGGMGSGEGGGGGGGRILVQF